jgi:hypothetical protein
MRIERLVSFFGYGLHFFSERVIPSGVNVKCGAARHKKDVGEFPALRIRIEQ